eukprot:scaffold63782_cov53-Phaeocystis_antarctica.AAC.1
MVLEHPTLRARPRRHRVATTTWAHLDIGWPPRHRVATTTSMRGGSVGPSGEHRLNTRAQNNSAVVRAGPSCPDYFGF